MKNKCRNTKRKGSADSFGPTNGKCERSLQALHAVGWGSLVGLIEDSKQS